MNSYPIVGYGDYDSNIHIRKLENGWVVTVDNPPPQPQDPTAKLYKAMASVLPSINQLAGSGMVRGVDEEMDSYKENDQDRDERAQKKLEVLQNVINKAFAEPPAPLRKPREEFVFLDHGKMLSFIAEQTKFDVPH